MLFYSLLTLFILALFTGILLGVITFYCVSLNNGLVHTLFSLSNIAQVGGIDPSSNLTPF